MKALLSLLLATALAITTCAMPLRHRPCRRIRRTPPARRQYPSWKTVVAGGVAVGTVIAAYKVSNGVEEGLKTTAEKRPEVFAENLSILTWPLRWGLLILMCASGWWLWRKYLGNKNNERKETPNADRSVEK